MTYGLMEIYTCMYISVHMTIAYMYMCISCKIYNLTRNYSDTGKVCQAQASTMRSPGHTEASGCDAFQSAINPCSLMWLMTMPVEELVYLGSTGRIGVLGWRSRSQRKAPVAAPNFQSYPPQYIQVGGSPRNHDKFRGAPTMYGS